MITKYTIQGQRVGKYSKIKVVFAAGSSTMTLRGVVVRAFHCDLLNKDCIEVRYNAGRDNTRTIPVASIISLTTYGNE